MPPRLSVSGCELLAKRNMRLMGACFESVGPGSSRAQRGVTTLVSVTRPSDCELKQHGMLSGHYFIDNISLHMLPASLRLYFYLLKYTDRFQHSHRPQNASAKVGWRQATPHDLPPGIRVQATSHGSCLVLLVVAAQVPGSISIPLQTYLVPRDCLSLSGLPSDSRPGL